MTNEPRINAPITLTGNVLKSKRDSATLYLRNAPSRAYCKKNKFQTFHLSFTPTDVISAVWEDLGSICI